MRILGVDTSSEILSLAILEEGSLLVGLERRLPRGHSSLLTPLVQEALKATHLNLSQIDGFAVGLGPGSFTGLRVGVATMKGFALALDKPIIGICSLDAIAHNGLGTSGLVCPILDAKRSLIYSAIYRLNRHSLKRISRYLLTSIEELLDIIEEKTLFLGDGLRLYKEKIMEAKGETADFAPEVFWFPKAAVVAHLGLIKFKKGEYNDPYKIVPMYLYPKQCSIRK